MKAVGIVWAAVMVAAVGIGCSDDAGTGGGTVEQSTDLSGISSVEGAGDDEEASPLTEPGEEETGFTKPEGTEGTEEPDAQGSGASESDGESTDPCTPGQAGFECPCAQNIDCLSGFCVEGPEGTICTDACLTECPSGYSCQGVSNLGPDVVFICVPDALKLCKPCTQDTQCGSSGRCVAFDDGFYCTQDCSENECATGYSCQDNDVEANGGFAKQCVPDSGVCDCTPDLYGETRPCLRTNEFGECFGFETCEAGSGWSNCTAVEPIEELCNGVDDNCDGFADEGLSQDEPCSDGPCEGVQICTGEEGWVCTAQIPSDEFCDGLDNDCDGETDEDFKDEESGLYVTVDNCGACGTACTDAFPNATGKCDASGDAPQCVVAACDNGFSAINEFQCIPEAADLCQACATDSDCVFGGAICLELKDGLFCGQACDEESECPAGYSCQDFDGNSQCAPIGGTCGCDGTNLLLSKACNVTYVDPVDPDAPVATCTGSQACTEVGWAECALPEDVCDGQDNNCDGVVDEGFLNPATGLYDTDAHCGKCGTNCATLNFPNGSGQCGDVEGIPVCQLACDVAYYDVNENPADGCECEFLSDTDFPDLGLGVTPVDANCDGVDGELGNGVFVAKNGDDDAPGTVDQPVLTIASAYAKAQADGKRDIYVATGVYQESVVLQEGIGVYGGYSSDFRQRDKILYETVVFGVAPTDQSPGAINCIGLGEADDALLTAFDGFTVFGFNLDTPGASSYGIYVRDCGSGVLISNNTVFAGDGGDGEDGLPGSAGADGLEGTAGAIAKVSAVAVCVAESTQGGSGGNKFCGAVNVAGGVGGTAVCPDYDNSGNYPSDEPIQQSSLAIENGGSGSGPDGGAGGEAGWDFLTYAGNSNGCGTCVVPPENHEWVGSDGTSGAPGQDGAEGSGCAAIEGSVVNGYWVGGNGQNGGSGDHGSGGGGGGAGGGVEVALCIGDTSDLGASGGGGGSGGCGATGGTSGQAGGGSFGIFVTYTAPPVSLPGIEGNAISAGQAGSGGDGGTGGVGGVGGLGGDGGTGGAQVPGAFCAAGGGYGGEGGKGGHGGGGGGACGGASFGIYVFGQGGSDLGDLKTLNSYTGSGKSGSGGQGGLSFGSPGENGGNGASSDTNF